MKENYIKKIIEYIIIFPIIIWLIPFFIIGCLLDKNQYDKEID